MLEVTNSHNKTLFPYIKEEAENDVAGKHFKDSITYPGICPSGVTYEDSAISKVFWHVREPRVYIMAYIT